MIKPQQDHRDAKAELIHRASATLRAAFHIEKLARELPVSQQMREMVDKLGDSLRDNAVALKREADALKYENRELLTQAAKSYTAEQYQQMRATMGARIDELEQALKTALSY